MLDNIGGFELLVIVLAALFIIGPERLPKVLSDVFSGLRKMRSMARTATADLSRELGTNIELEDLHPKTFIRKHLLSEAEEEALRKPFQDVYRDVRTTADSLNMTKGPVGADPSAAAASPPTAAPVPAPAPNGGKPPYAYDDAT